VSKLVPCIVLHHFLHEYFGVDLLSKITCSNEQSCIYISTLWFTIWRSIVEHLCEWLAIIKSFTRKKKESKEDEKKERRKKKDPIMVNTPILTNWVNLFEKCKKEN
jgi:hypothetical protein